MVDDFLAKGGALFLGSRLRRLGDSLYREVLPTLAEYGNLAPNQVPVLACLEEHGEQSVGELAGRLRASQPGLTRIVSRLSALGLVETKRKETDQRLSLVALTPFGHELTARMREDYWPRVGEAAASLFENVGGDFLTQIQDVEAALKARGMTARIRSARTGRERFHSTSGEETASAEGRRGPE